MLAGLTANVVPVPTNVPPQLTVYHLHTAPAPKLPPVIPNVVEVEPLHNVVPAVLVIAVGAVLRAFTLTTAEPLNPLTGTVQPLASVTAQGEVVAGRV